LEATPPRLDLDAIPTAGAPIDPLSPCEDSMAPLAGIRVLDFSMGWAGPLATRMLSDLGAEVIKIEAGRYPDWWRAVDWSPEAIERGQYEESRHFSVINRGKQSVSLDLTQPAGLALAKQLADKCDIIVENQAAGVMPRLGLGYEQLSEGRDDLIMLSMSAFGSGNDWSETRAYGSVLEQGSGLPSFCGEPDWPPTMGHLAYGDPIGGIYGGASLLTALYHRRRSGQGQWINNTQIEAMLPFTTAPVLIRQATGREPVRRGNRHSANSPHGMFPCLGDDNWLAISVSDDAGWQGLAKLIGWTGDGQTRRADETAIEAAISAWSRPQTREAAASALQALGVAAAPVWKLHEVDQDAHLKARAFFYDVERRHIGQQYQAGLPFRRNGMRYPMRGLAPFLGGDSEAALTSIVGIEQSEFQQLLDTGVVSLTPTQLRGS
jgi:crotonobetainyl-CoA:carnitine CoA-transferase CaiB-like acyl-CoA transferase